jgi:hypothetical protein
MAAGYSRMKVKGEEKGESAMAMTITNRAQRLIILQLNDGSALYLAPGESSRPVNEVKVSGNEKVRKLMNESVISLSSVKESTKDADAEAPKQKGAQGSKRGSASKS